MFGVLAKLLVCTVLPSFNIPTTMKLVDSTSIDFPLMHHIPSVIANSIPQLGMPFDYLQEKVELSENSRNVIVGPIYEEFVFRFGIQKLFMKELPKIIFNKNEAGSLFIHSTPAKISRILLTSFLFTSYHYMNGRDDFTDKRCAGEEGHKECTLLGNVQFYSTFLGGIAAGTAMELTNNILYPIALHTQNNANMFS